MKIDFIATSSSPGVAHLQSINVGFSPLTSHFSLFTSYFLLANTDSMQPELENNKEYNHERHTEFRQTIHCAYNRRLERYRTEAGTGIRPARTQPGAGGPDRVQIGRSSSGNPQAVWRNR